MMTNLPKQMPPLGPVALVFFYRRAKTKLKITCFVIIFFIRSI